MLSFRYMFYFTFDVRLIHRKRIHRLAKSLGAFAYRQNEVDAWVLTIDVLEPVSYPCKQFRQLYLRTHLARGVYLRVQFNRFRCLLGDRYHEILFIL